MQVNGYAMLSPVMQFLRQPTVFKSHAWAKFRLPDEQKLHKGICRGQRQMRLVNEIPSSIYQHRTTCAVLVSAYKVQHDRGSFHAAQV